MSNLASIIFLVVFAVVMAGLITWAVRRPRPYPVAPDLRRADDAEANMPDADTITERVSGSITQNWPMK